MKFRSRGLNRVVKVLPGGSKPIEALEQRMMLSLLGTQLYPSDYPWNQSIANAPVSPLSTAIINNIIANNGGTNGPVHPDMGQDTKTAGQALYGIPYNVVHGNTTTDVSVTLTNYAGENDQVAAPLLTSFAIEGDNQTGPPSTTKANGGDSHLIVWDEDNNIAYEFDGCARPSQTTSGKWTARQETVWYMNTDQFRTIGDTSVDAAGLSILAGLLRPDEGLPVSQGGAGVITHALRMTLENCDVLDQFIYPASHEANSGTNTAVLAPMGTRFRLNPADVNLSSLDPESRVVAVALETYGLILADNGSDFFISGASYSVNASNAYIYNATSSTNLTWNNNDILSHSAGLESLTFSDFQVVNLTPEVAAVSQSSGLPGSTVTITGNGFSGAAGHLSVLFGSTTSSTINILSDTQVTAVVPSGSGAANITVQSGVSTTDHSSVTYPIFGYGKSSPATAFTILSPATISGRVFRDENSNGTFDTGSDTGLVGQLVYLDIGSTGSQTGSDPTMTTVGPNGTYSFTGVTPGINDTVRLVTQPTGFALDNASSNSVTPTSGGTSTVNLGYFPDAYNDSAADLYTLQLDMAGANINILVNGNLTYIAPTALPPSLTFNLSSTASDSLTVNLANGDPIPAGNVSYTGGSGTNALVITGAPSANNSIFVNGTKVSIGTANGRAVTYSNIESIAVNTGSGNDTLTQSAQPGNGATLSFTGGTGSDYLNVTGGNFIIPADPTANGTASLAVTVGGTSSPASVTFKGSAVSGSGIIPYHLAGLTVSANGAATLSPSASGQDSDRTLLTTNSLSVAGTLDIQSNSVDVHYGANTTPFPAIKSAILAGNITSNFGDASRAIGYADGADGVVPGLASGDILIRYVPIGDVNLDGTVNFSDLLLLAQHYGASGANWDNGDLNGDGTVNFSDLLALAQHYGSSQPAALAAMFGISVPPTVATPAPAPVTTPAPVKAHHHKAKSHKD